MSEEEKNLLEQLRNTSLATIPPHHSHPPQVPPPNPAHLHNDVYQQYKQDIEDGRHTQNSQTTNSLSPPRFAVPNAPSPLSSRKFHSQKEEGNLSVENLSVENLASDSKKNIKLSSDSGLGSSELGEEHQSWKNGENVVVL